MLSVQSVAALVFPYQVIQKVMHPPIVIHIAASPDCGWMILVCRTIEDGIASIGQLALLVAVEYTMCCGEQLCRLHDHFYNVLITMVTRSRSRVTRQIEDVQRLGSVLAVSSCFSSISIIWWIVKWV